jgi:hypothetical protein
MLGIGIGIGCIVSGIFGFIICAVLVASDDESEHIAEYLAKKNVVVLPCDIGDKLYAIYDGTDEDVRDVAKVEELTVTEIGTSRIFCSSYVPPRDDISFVIPIRELGVKYFFVREDAERMLKGGGEE